MTGYSGTPLPKKLGVKPDLFGLLLNVPDEVHSLAEFDSFKKSRKTYKGLSGRQFDYIHLFVKDRKILENAAPVLRELLLPDGMLWISWPKKSSKVETNITEGTLREVILPIGLVDVKVCAVNTIWSGLKFMFRKDLRADL